MSGTLLSGNEAVARGAWEAGVKVGVGYPGTPSTETLESFVKLPDVYAEWAPNEKVALEVAAGASLGGVRVLVTMKHVGLNVAADPLFTLAYTGVGGGLVILVADDPGMHSSQNEQDSRNYARFAKVALVEPSDSGEALEFTKQAFELSERFDIPVIVRSTTRVSHSKGLVETGDTITPAALGEYVSDPSKWVMMPAMARRRRVDLDDRLSALVDFAETTSLNRVEMRDSSIGIVTSGVSYQYVREAMPEASVFKLGMGFPLPVKRLTEFASSVGRLVVVEEADPYLESSLRSMGLEVSELYIPRTGELSSAAIGAAFGLSAPQLREAIDDLPPRPPLMCPGCPHRGAYHALRKINAIVTGDIGCYTLGALPPMSSMDSCVCMGASIGMAHGLEIARSDSNMKRPVVAVIGDSTFAHSGMAGLVDIAYNGGASTVAILDNRITAMTGHQGNPLNGQTLMGTKSRELNIEALCSALGIDRVRTVDPHDLAASVQALREETAHDGLSVIVFKAPCALLLKEKELPFSVNDEMCNACGLCIGLGCPAISKTSTGKAEIDVTICVGCSQCVQVCRYDAIEATGPACDIGGV
ncbi:MAG: indolepyruvate ferredoxin oxidoreductase subunit alpha [Actinomycetota bacterium]|nr:indolepyruvate ferredoxin oxidoreductase subunit alpha [Actinomycetota bacterium]